MGKAEILQQWFDKGKDDLRSAEYLSTMRHPTMNLRLIMKIWKPL